MGRARHSNDWTELTYGAGIAAIGRRWRRLARDLAWGLREPFTFDLARNAHLWVGALWAVTLPVLALAIDLGARGAPATLDELQDAVLERPVHLWFLAQPLLMGLTFGAFGSIRARRLRQVARLEAERDRSRREAEFLVGRQLEAEDAKHRLLSTVSHELETPLTSLRGYAELVRSGRLGPLTAAQERALDVVVRAARRECALIEELLRYARLESRRYPIEPGPFDLRAAVAVAREALALEAARRPVRLETVAPDVPVRVHADRVAIEHAIENLLSNAIKFAPPGGRARLSVARAGGAAVVTVEDDGPGIPPELWPRVFEAFFQGDSSDAREHGGAGIGLPVARGIIEAHRATLSVDRSPLGGAAFRFSLPLERAAADGLAFAEGGPSHVAGEVK